MALVTRRRLCSTLLLLLAFLAACAAGPGGFVLEDQAEALERAQVEAAAAPLVARGARVAVFVAASGDDTGADFTRRLDAAGLLAGGQIAPEAIALYVSYGPRYSELRAGSRWSGSLPDGALREIRTAILNPALREGQPGPGVAATLGALEERIASPPLLARVFSGLIYLVVAAFAVFVLAVSPLGEGLGRWWWRSPLGRLVRWLGDQTPPGRRRIERILKATSRRLDDRVAYAQSSYKAAVKGPHRADAAPLDARFAALAERRVRAEAALKGRALEAALDELAWDYTKLGHDAARLVPPRPERKARGRAAASGFFAAGESSSSSPSSSSSDSSTSWDSGPSDPGPSSDGGSW